MTTLLPTTREIREVFLAEITALGGRESGVWRSGGQLLLGSILAREFEVSPGDTVNAGVACRTRQGQILVYPYIYRQVCDNGAITTWSSDASCIERAPFSASCEAIERVKQDVRLAVRGCAAPGAFEDACSRMRLAMETEVDLIAWNVETRITGAIQADHLQGILRRLEGEAQELGGRSMYALMNAITSFARDTEDASLRWDLEELGGGVLALCRPDTVGGGAAASLHASSCGERFSESCEISGIARLHPLSD